MYGIIHKQTKKYFAGFNDDHSSKWTSVKSEAYRASFNEAQLQASLLAMFDNVQKKPVAA